MNNKLHPNEIHIESELVRRLLECQFPEYEPLPINKLGNSGSSNVQFALGDGLLVRMPRLPRGGEAIAKESRWTQTLGTHLPVAVPEVVAMGEPALGYSEQWSIVSWQAGEHPKVCSPNDQPTKERMLLAKELAEIVIAFRNIEVSRDALDELELKAPYRGHTLSNYDAQMRQNIENCKYIKGLDLDLEAVTFIWNQALTLPGADKSIDSCNWFHGDIVAENLLQRDGHLTGLLDFGGIGIGDPTVDLHGAWELLDAPAREAFRSRLNIDEPEWLRGRAWALAVALMTFPYYWNTMPNRVKDRYAMARAVLSDQT